VFIYLFDKNKQRVSAVSYSVWGYVNIRIFDLVKKKKLELDNTELVDFVTFITLVTHIIHIRIYKCSGVDI